MLCSLIIFLYPRIRLFSSPEVYFLDEIPFEKGLLLLLLPFVIVTLSLLAV